MMKKFCCIALAIFAIPAVARSQNLPDLDSLSARIKPEVSAARSLDFDPSFEFEVRYYSAAEVDTVDISEFYPQAYLENYDLIIRTIGLYRGARPLGSETITGPPDAPLPIYYDPNPENRSINIPMREYNPEEGEDLASIMAHELAHALQDQHFGLDNLFIGAKNSDQVIARQSLVEGGATLVELLVDSARAGQTVPDSRLQEVINDALNEALSIRDPESPQFLVESQYITPYLRGRAFVFALKQHGGWDAVNRAYTNPPSSTEHIFHPDKYIVRESFEEIALPALAGETFAADWERLDTDTLGELGFRNIFNAFDIETSHVAAAGWDGDRYAVFKHRRENTAAFVLFTTWDTEWDATEFMTAYKSVLTIKLQGAENFKIDQRGTDVLIAESPRDLNALFAYAEKVRSTRALQVFDFNDDLIIDFDDFLIFARHFGRISSDPDFDPRFDFDGDGMVGFLDFLKFAAEFGKTIAPTPNAKPTVAIDPRVIHNTLGFIR